MCLTHDVDFINIVDYGLDRSVLGFVIRALFPRQLRDVRSHLVWSRLFRNWRALLSLPAVYLRLCRDVWFDIDRFMKIEADLAATYFFIPFRGRAGLPLSGDISNPLRAAAYDAS